VKIRETTGKGGTQWEIRAARRIRKRVKNRRPRNRNKNQKLTLISSQKERLDKNRGVHPCGAVMVKSSFDKYKKRKVNIKKRKVAKGK
jgi:hypothetical protein